MSIKDACNTLGVDERSVYWMRHGSKEKYKYISSLDDDFAESYKAYENMKEILLSDLTDMYYLLADKKRLTELGRLLTVKGLFSSSASFYVSINKFIFKSDLKMNHDAFLKYTKVLEIYKELEK